MFHVSLLCFNSLIINIFYDWNIELLCFIFTFNVSCQKHSGRKTKTLRERFKNTEGAISKHWGSDNTLPQCFEKWNMKLKMKHSSRMFHFSKWLIFSYFTTKSETWKIKWRFWKRIEIVWNKLQFICLIGGLIGGRVFNPRQQQVLSIYL